ncbi:hypothetical protein BGZ73_009097 [Actinomortierella ambigua]|nr:hypothetical protein BGZ73_009097 [Actinomortierella ambigua]
MRAFLGRHGLVLAAVLYAVMALLAVVQPVEARRHKNSVKGKHHGHHQALSKGTPRHYQSHLSTGVAAKKKGHSRHSKKSKGHRKKHGHDQPKNHHKGSQPEKALGTKDISDTRCSISGSSAPQKTKARPDLHLHHWSSRFNLTARPIGPGAPPNPLWIANKGIPKVPPAKENRPLINIGYYAGWTQSRGIHNKACQQRPYLPSDIPWSSMEYVMFAFAYIDDAAEIYPASEEDEKLYDQINQLKQATNTRVLLSIGGWAFTHPNGGEREDTRSRFANMVQTPEMRKQFIASCIAWCEYYGFDGIDIDWEYPPKSLRSFVTQLFQEMRSAFDNHGHGLVITIAGASSKESVEGFEFDKIVNAIDLFQIMSYDLYGWFDRSGIVNIHTSLVQMPTEHHRGHSVQSAVELFVDLGVPRSKIVVGMALYGKTFTLTNPQQTTPGIAHFRAAGPPAECTDSAGEIAYNEIASLMRHNRPQWDPNAHAFYMVYGPHNDSWVGYDDRASVDLKLQLVTENELAGIMWWSLDQDLDRTSAWAGASTHKRHDDQALFVASIAPDGKTRNVQGDSSCPVLAQPPGNLAAIPKNQLGQPGLVLYAAQKRTHCPALVQLPLALPRTPLGNTVFVKCPAVPGCPTSRMPTKPTHAQPKAGANLLNATLDLVRATTRDREDPAADNASHKHGHRHGNPRNHHSHRHRYHSPLTAMVDPEQHQSIDAHPNQSPIPQSAKKKKGDHRKQHKKKD